MACVLAYKTLDSENERISAENTEKVSLITRIVKNALISMMLEGKGTEFKGFFRTFSVPEINAVRLFKADGTIACSTQPSEIDVQLSAEKVGISQPELNSYEQAGRLIYSMKVPIFNEMPCKRCHGIDKEMMGILDVEFIIEKSKSRNLETIILTFLGVLVIIPVCLSLITAFFVTRPIENIISSIKRIEGGDISTRFVEERKDEVGRLAGSLNFMLDEMSRVRQDADKCHIESMQRVEKMATIGELASAIAHEIKNPLAGISGAIQVFAEDFSEEDPRKTIINEVLTEIERLDKAVRDLLNFAKPPEPYRIKTHIMPVIERAVRLLGAQAKKQNVDINTVVMQDIKEVYIDPEQMQQVFLNIMLNALHSMLEEGSITIATYLREETKEAEISISDTGHGITEENIKNVFKPFFTTRHMGTGLGLAISKNIVEKHGGRIELESRVGGGSNFRVILPLGVKDV
ncbi:MAG: HAMP domain-containing protein [Nitrospirae bacterium]|nr:HAMP domain-containing protein [Nitrospirota bacterium]